MLSVYAEIICPGQRAPGKERAIIEKKERGKTTVLDGERDQKENMVEASGKRRLLYLIR